MAQGHADDVKSSRWLVASVTSVGVFVAFLDATIVNIAMPEIVRSFPTSGIAMLSWVLNAYNVVFAAFLVPCGRLIDRWGRRRGFMFGLALFTIASVACGIAPGPEVLITARAVQALGAAILVPSSMALLLPEFPAARRSTAVAIWAGTAMVAAAAGPALGGVLLDAYGWRSIFMVNVPFGVLALSMAGVVLAESHEPVDTPFPDMLSALLVAVGMGALALAIVKGRDWGWTDARVIGPLALAALLVSYVATRSRQHPAPIVEPAIMRHRAFAAANLATIMFAASFFAALLCNALFLTQVWRYSLLQAGMALAPAPLISMIVAFPGGRMADRFGPRSVAVCGVLIYVGGVALYATRLSAHADFLWGWLPAALATGTGGGLGWPALAAAALATVPADRFATTSAVINAARQIGAVIGIAVLVAIVGQPSPNAMLTVLRHGWWMSVIVGLTAAGGAAAVGRIPVAESAEAPLEIRADGG